MKATRNTLFGLAQAILTENVVVTEAAQKREVGDDDYENLHTHLRHHFTHMACLDLLKNDSDSTRINTVHADTAKFLKAKADGHMADARKLYSSLRGWEGSLKDHVEAAQNEHESYQR